MGNTSSAPTSPTSPTSPTDLKGTKGGTTTRRTSVFRRRTSSSDNTHLAVPAGSHRRSRSAHGAIHFPQPNPPPPYSAAPPPGAIPVPIVMPVPPRPPVAVSPMRTRMDRPQRSATYLRAPMRRETQEDALQMLKDYDTVIILDDSGSMAGRLWREATDALAQMAEYAGQYDVDGIDVYFLNDPRAGHGLRTRESVENLFRDVVPRGVTPIGARLERLLRVYLHDLEAAHATGELARVDAIKAVNYIIITDGAPTDDPESVIVQAARRLDEKHFPTTQVGIQFVQIGSSRSATRFLQELDDALSERHKIRDIVDTTPYLGRLTGDTLVKVLLGGINRRVDRQPVVRR